MARLSTELSAGTVDNLAGETLCIQCNPLRRAGFEARPHLMNRLMRRSGAEQEMGKPDPG